MSNGNIPQFPSSQIFEWMWPQLSEAFLSQQAAMGKLPSGQTDIGLGQMGANLAYQTALPEFQYMTQRRMAAQQQQYALQQMNLQRQWSLEDMERQKKAGQGAGWGKLIGTGVGGLLGFAAGGPAGMFAGAGLGGNIMGGGGGGGGGYGGGGYGGYGGYGGGGGGGGMDYMAILQRYQQMLNQMGQQGGMGGYGGFPGWMTLP